MSFVFEDFVKTRDFPQARDWRVRSISFSSKPKKQNKIKLLEFGLGKVY